MSTDGEDRLRETLDQVFSGDTQTYEQFLNRFLFLRREDVTSPSEDQLHSLENSDTSQVNGHSHNSSNGINGLVSHETLNNLSQNADKLEPNKEERRLSESSNHSLSEEDIGPGSHAPSMLMRTSETTGGTIVQLDNFVDDEGSPLSDLSPEDSGDDAESSYTFSGHKIHPSQTGMQSHLSQTGTQFHLSYTQTQSHQNPPELDGLSNNCTEDRADMEQALLDDHKITEQNDDQESGDDERNPKEGSCSDGVKPLPGEVDSEVFKGEVLSPRSTNVRHLNIKTTFRDCPEEDNSEGTTSYQENDIEYCEVEPFSIDEDFDYDNVILTPKFNFMSSHVNKEDAG